MTPSTRATGTPVGRNRDATDAPVGARSARNVPFNPAAAAADRQISSPPARPIEGVYCGATKIFLAMGVGKGTTMIATWSACMQKIECLSPQELVTPVAQLSPPRKLDPAPPESDR